MLLIRTEYHSVLLLNIPQFEFVWCVFMGGVRLDILGRNTTIKKRKKRILCHSVHLIKGCIVSMDLVTGDIYLLIPGINH